jgi:catechol 2,3-dioxygenase-like lactoylglutathione lyase family enzyme
MGILEAAKPIIVICTRERTRAAAFYRDTLGLRLLSEDNLAALFEVGGTVLRVSTVPGFNPQEHTILGFRVPDVTATVRELRGKGLNFNTYQGSNQDELGILIVPGTEVRVAWFKDPDGNVLSVTDA